MIVFYKTQIARTNKVRDQAIVMAMELQFTALNRVSELLPTAADYYARAVDIRFGFDLSGDGTITTLFSEQSWTQSIDTLRSMTFRIRGSKTDQQRLGVTLYFEVMDETSPHIAFCVVRDAFRWAQFARPRGRDAFISFRNRWGLEYEEYNAANQTNSNPNGLPTGTLLLHPCNTHWWRIRPSSSRTADFSNTFKRPSRQCARRSWRW